MPELREMFEVREIPGLLYWLDVFGKTAVCGIAKV